MGKVIVARALYNDGTSRRIENWQKSDPIETTYRIEFEYDYGPCLLPPLAADDEGMWRYTSLLPLEDKERLYPLAVGNTPLIASRNLRASTGISSLWLKDETRSPTGSNKDRATALIMEYALHRGIEVVSCASTGNVAASLAVGAAASGLNAMIFVPDNVSATKLQIMNLTGATIFKVIEGYEAAVKLSLQAARAFGWYDRNTGYNPLTLEAKKTVALEIWEQLGRQVPDVMVIPVGDGVTLSGIAKGFRELVLCGAADRCPRLIGVQANGCQPLKIAWERNTEVRPAQAATIADGIAVEFPINATMALRDVRASGGALIAISDEAILQAVKTLASQGGILAEPAGAAAFAGLKEALASGLVECSERVVVLVTGTGLKTLHHLSSSSLSTVHQIHANLNTVKEILLSDQ